MLREARAEELPEFDHKIVAVDLGYNDEYAITVVGLTKDKRMYVLFAESGSGDFVSTVVKLFHRFGARCVVADKGLFADLVQKQLLYADPSIPVSRYHCRIGTYLRAEKVASLYASGRIRHYGNLRELELELLGFGEKGSRKRVLEVMLLAVEYFTTLVRVAVRRML